MYGLRRLKHSRQNILLLLLSLNVSNRDRKAQKFISTRTTAAIETLIQEEPMFLKTKN